MRPTILVVLACCTQALGTRALPVRNHGRLARTYALEDKRDLPGLFGGLGGGEADLPVDGKTEDGIPDSLPSGVTAHGDDTSSNSLNLLPGLEPTSSEISKTKGTSTSTASSSASAAATPVVHLATTTQAEPASTLSGSAATATPPANEQAQSSESNAASSSDSWKIIGVAVICFTAVVVVLVAAVFFDTWWRFLRDLFWRRHRPDDLEEMVPDWQKASWEVRCGDPHRYPSFGSLPTSPALRGDPLQRQRSLRVQEWQKDETISRTSSPGSGLTPTERLAQYPALPPNAYVSPNPRPCPGSVDPFKDKSLSPNLGFTQNGQDTTKDPFRDAQISPRTEVYDEK